MATTDECCAVCAELLEFVAIARCGHAESCGKCALRLRAVLDDERCVICQQPGDCVFVTRSAGELTSAPRPEAFDGFKVSDDVFFFFFSFFFPTSLGPLSPPFSFSHTPSSNASPPLSLPLFLPLSPYQTGPGQGGQALAPLQSAGLFRRQGRV